MAAYLDAKLRLFRELLLPEGTAVVNVDDPAGAEVVAACRARGVKLIAYGRAQADLRLIDQRPTPPGQVLRLEIFGTACEVALPVADAFQPRHALAALGPVLASGVARDRAVAALAPHSRPPPIRPPSLRHAAWPA